MHVGGQAHSSFRLHSSPAPHTIRLREPWERELLDDGSLQLTRRFHRPTGLDGKSSVWLVIDGLEVNVALNDQPLGRTEPAEAGTPHATKFDITHAIGPENVISIIVKPGLPQSDSQMGELTASVRLEIEESDTQR